MNLKKLKELKFDNNDIYILENYAEKVLINDNYEGLIFFDYLMDKLQRLSIINDLTVYSVYKKFDDGSVLLYCLEDEQMVLVDINKLYFCVISLVEIGQDVIFSPVYYWHSDVLVLVTFSGDFYLYNFALTVLEKISNDEVQKICPDYFDFWKTCKEYNLERVYSNKYAFVFKKNLKVIGYFNAKTGKNISVNNMSNGWHDVESNGEAFVFVHEEKLEVIMQEKKIIIEPELSYSFLRVRFLTTDTIAVLSSNRSDSTKCIINTYQIIKMTA